VNLTVSEKIKSIRKQFNLTQIDFAISLKIAQGTLSEIENGKAKPSFEVLSILANVYAVDLNWLVIDNQKLGSGLLWDEVKLLDNFRNLEESAKSELLDISDIKLIRYRNSPKRIPTS
jgi:transcriptional regulator with XRE-family HTH domain